ncbi:inositol hexakisphosphate kinase 2b [Chanos chanos]|uniref:Kinase n=1 Tax=Chanos chanos TaxID=29144 RepID=A0A6J2VLX8_CHACN|nr:inositol hexakisphosphate kinase 2-like [Chanos chanos]
MSPALETLMEGCRCPAKEGLKGGVMLEPFVHQVGGHSCVLRFGEQTICKPLIPREHQFYKSLPPEIRRFTPQYRGVVSVSFEEDEDGDLCLIAYPLHSEGGALENKESLVDAEPKGKHLKWGQKKHGSLLLENERGRQIRKEDKSKSNREDKAEVLYCSLEKGNVVPQIKHNPWSLQCHQQHLQRMKENSKHRNQHKFILLENLTWRYRVPCVLDLKMGTRQHGDDASEEKKANQIRKCQQSTSATIGVRLCGMQVYHSATGQLIFMNKYLGRKLSLAGFKEALVQFFSDGRVVRRELLSPVLRRLREMRDVLEECESYRFFSSSLLVIYDGAPPASHTRTRPSRGGEEGDDDDDEDDEGEDDEEGAFGGRSRRPSDAAPPQVDVRMIDFAHTTCRDYGEDGVVHEGGDSGYIFGLQNLISILSQLEENTND